MLFEKQISILDYFLKDHVIMKTGYWIYSFEIVIFNSNNISQYYWFWNIVDQIYGALVSIRDLFQKH